MEAVYHEGVDRVAQITAEWAVVRPGLEVGDVAVIGRLHRVGKALTAELVACYGQFGLSEAEFDLLCALRRRGVSRPADLAAATMVTTGGISKQLDRLEATGLARRREHLAHDRRSRTVELTPAGVELIDRAFEAHLANERRLLAELSPSDLEDLRRVMSVWLPLLEGHPGPVADRASEG